MKNEITERFWSEIQKNAEKRGIGFFLNLDEAWKIYLIQNKKCAITNSPLEFISYGYRGNASLDRINSDLPYVWHNVQWVLADINVMKKEHNMNYFINLCKMVVNPLK